MNPKRRRHRIYDLLERFHELKVRRESELEGGGRMCPIYSPPQRCVGEKCVWFDKKSMECWILNPKPKPMTDE